MIQNQVACWYGFLLRWAILSAVMLSWLPAWAQAPDHDVLHSEKYLLRITDKGRLQLQSKVDIEHSYLSKRSTEQHTFFVHEDAFTKVDSIRGWVRGETLEKTSITRSFAQRSDIFLSGVQIHRLEFPSDMRVGETISYSYEQEYQDLAFMPRLAVPNLDLIQGFQVTLEHPADIRVDFDLHFPLQPVTSVVERPNTQLTRIRFSRFPQQKRLTHVDDAYAQAYILPRISRAGQLLTPATPEAFTDWYLKRLVEPKSGSLLLPEALRAGIGAARDDRQRVRILYDFIKEHIRYAADETAAHAITPHDPVGVLRDGFGDCKDKAFLLQQLARGLGIQIDLVLVFSRRLPETFGLSVEAFNHMICHFKDGQGSIFMDPTYRDVVFGNLPGVDSGRMALVLDPKQPRLVQLPDRRSAPCVELTVQGSLRAPRQAVGRAILRNDMQALALRGRRELGAMDLENQLSNALNQHLYKVALDHFEFEREGPDGVEFRVNVNLEDFLVKSPTKYYAPQVPFRTLGGDLLTRREDDLAVHIAHQPWIRLTMDLEDGVLPAPAVPLNLVRHGSEAFRASCTAMPSGLRLAYEARPSGIYFVGQEKSEYLDYHEQYLKARRNMFTMTRSQQ